MEDYDGNVGLLGKFRQRLRNIKISRNKKKVNNEEFINEKVKEIREVIRNDNTLVLDRKKYKGTNHSDKLKENNSISNVIINIRNTSKDRDYIRKKVGSNNKVDISFNRENIDSKIVEENNNLNKVISVRKNKRISIGSKKRKVGSNLKDEELLNKLGAEIILKIRNNFEYRLDELDVLMSELYFLEKSQENLIELNKAKELKEKISIIINKINDIINEYNLYKKNYYIENIVDIDDSVLADDIINYRYLLDSFSLEKGFVKEYKALDEFKELYNKLKEVKNEASNLVLKNEEKIVEFDIRDKKYNDIKLGMIPISKINNDCMIEIERQNEYFNNLMKKINVINKKEYVTMHLKGVGDLVGKSLNYIGLLMLSPLAGLIPSIAIQTLATKKMIGNIYNNIHFESVKHIHYSAINYDSEVSHHLCSISYTSELLNDTLKDIKKLRESFLKQYDCNLKGYEDTLKKINAIENGLLRNQNKLDIINKNLIKSKKINEDKIIKVKKLNDN